MKDLIQVLRVIKIDETLITLPLPYILHSTYWYLTQKTENCVEIIIISTVISCSVSLLKYLDGGGKPLEMKSSCVSIVFFIHQFSSSSAFVPAAIGRSQNTSHNKNILVLTMTEEKSTTTSISSSSNSKSKSRRLYSFEEARRIARGHGFGSKEEFQEYMCPGAYQIPKDADVVWAESWQGWEDFLGITLTFSEGREVAHKLEGIDTEEDGVNEEQNNSRRRYFKQAAFPARFNVQRTMARLGRLSCRMNAETNQIYSILLFILANLCLKDSPILFYILSATDR